MTRASLRAELEELNRYLEPPPPGPDPSWLDHVDGAPSDAPSGRVRVAGRLEFGRGDHVEVAAHYAESLSDAVYDLGTTHVYDASRGIYVPLAPSVESCSVQGYAGVPAGRRGEPLQLRSADVEGVLKLARARLAVPGFFGDAPAGLAFTDGFVTASAEGARLVAHAAEHRARHGFAFPFDGPADPIRFVSMLREAFEPDEDREQKIALIQEFAGSSLLGLATRYQRCVVFTGEGANGKSAVIRVVESAMPPGSVTSIPPQRWHNEYRRAALATALLNPVNELPEGDILDAEVFKAIVSGDAIDAREIYKPPFTLKPRAGHLFAANHLPGSNDTTLGFWRRFVVVPFNRRFEGSQAKPRLAEDIIAAEHAVIVRWLVQGAVRAMLANGYTIPPSSLEAVAAWRRCANPVAIFVEECTRDAGPAESGTSASQVYARFGAWCERNGHRALSATKFGMRMRELGKGSEKTRTANLHHIVFTDGSAR